MADKFEAYRRQKFFAETPDPHGNFSFKRGKLVEAAPGGAAWGMTGGDGQGFYPDLGKRALDEALGD